MKSPIHITLRARQFVATAALIASTAQAEPPDKTSTLLPTGQSITPTLLEGSVQQALNPNLGAYPNFVAGEAVRSQLSPDGATLAVLCAGQNSLYKPDGKVDVAASTQFIFLYDVAGPNKAKPALKQVIPQVNSHIGLVFSPDGRQLYAAGGKDDAVYVYARGASAWAPAGSIALKHAGKGVGLNVQPNASGLAVSADGKTLVVANNYNDSISVIDTATRAVRYEHDLRPFFANNEGVSGAAGGTYPFAVAIKGNGLAYVSSDRDREVIAIDISSPAAGRLVKRIKLEGNALGMTFDATQSRLFVAQDNADQVAVIDTSSNTVLAKIDARAPDGLLNGTYGDDDPKEKLVLKGLDALERNRRPADRQTGAATFTVTMAPDGQTLYAVNAGANAIAVIPLVGQHAYSVAGLIPTAYEPHDITLSADGSWMYIVNGKSSTGPNPKHLSSQTANITSTGTPVGGKAAAADALASNQYQFQLEHASLVSAPIPDQAELKSLTHQVAENNFYGDSSSLKDRLTMRFLRHYIKHVVYIVKENRTYDQILGDLDNGSNGDPALTQFGKLLTPNFHRLASNFVTLDNFMDPGDGSMDGWSWALQGRVTNTETITQQINYAAVNRGLSYESEGMNRGVPVNFNSVAERDAATGPVGTTTYSTASAALPGGTANLLPGSGNHASTDAPFGVQKGYIFNAVLAAGGTVRNYGFLVNNIGSIGNDAAPVSSPFASGVKQVAPLEPSLAPLTDPYFRGYDQNYPDLWRYNEWKREFDQFVANGNMPNLSLVRLSHDHMGSFGTALAGVNTPETQQADNDLSVGRLVEAIAHSRYAASTLIIITEDDVQDGPDHVDSHRATTYVVGPYVKKGAVVNKRYSQVNALRTIEDILGTRHMNVNTAYQKPMTDVFDLRSSRTWTYDAVASTVLGSTRLGLAQGTTPVQFADGPVVMPQHEAQYWNQVTAGFNFSQADQVPTEQFNKVLWTGLMGKKPYPAIRGPVAMRKEAED